MGRLLFFLFLRLMRGHPRCFILDLLQLFPIDRRLHRVLNRNQLIRNAWQCVGNNLARPVSDAVSFRQFILDFFEFGKNGFAFRFQRRTLLLIERRRKPQRLHELFAQPDCFLQPAQFVAVFGFVLFAFAAPVDALVYLLNRLQFSDGLNRTKQRVNITDSAFLCRRFRFDFGKYPLSFGNVLSKPTDRVKLVIREEGNRFEAVLQIMDSAIFLRIAIPCFVWARTTSSRPQNCAFAMSMHRRQIPPSCARKCWRIGIMSRALRVWKVI